MADEGRCEEADEHSDGTAAAAEPGGATARTCSRELLKLTASPLLEELEVKRLHEYIDQVATAMANAVQRSQSEAHHVGGGGGRFGGRGPAGQVLSVPDRGGDGGGRHGVAAERPLQLALAVVRKLTKKQMMALLGMRHTRATPEWAPPPSHAALYSVRGHTRSHLAHPRARCMRDGLCLMRSHPTHVHASNEW